MILNQITLPCNNLPESIAFYKKLGLQQIVDSEHYARFVCQGNQLTLSLHCDDQSTQTNSTIIYFESDNLDQQIQLLEKAGLVFSKPPQDQPWLWREAYLHDPSGNKICLYWAGENRLNPPWRMQP